MNGAGKYNSATFEGPHVPYTPAHSSYDYCNDVWDKLGSSHGQVSKLSPGTYSNLWHTLFLLCLHSWIFYFGATN